VTVLLDGTALLPCARDPQEWDLKPPPLARRVCLSCRRRVLCQAQAIGRWEEVGMWGGLSAYQARRVRQVLDADGVGFRMYGQWWLRATDDARAGVLLAAGVNPETLGGDS
jgi:hypothetical protein